MYIPEFERGGAKLYYEEKGKGSPILFTHGASWNHKQWRPQVSYFAKSHRAIVWDVRGHGYSSLPGGRVDPEDFSRDLIGLLDHLHIEQAVLCGLSMGGHISLQTAIRYSSRVKALVLIGTPCTNTFNLYERVFVPVNRFISRFMPMKMLGRIQANMLSKFNPDNRAYIEEAFAMIKHKDWVRIWDAVTRMESKHDLYKVLCPTLLLVGDHDSLTMRQQEFMHRSIPRSGLVIISGAHHATNLDNPGAVNEAIEQFLHKNFLTAKAVPH